MYDGTTAGLALTRFKWSVKRAMDVPGGATYEDFSYSFSTYNTQMYMGYNNAVVGSEGDGSNLRFWDGDTTASSTAVDFDTFNQEATILTVDGALSGLYNVSVAVILSATMLYSF